MTGLRKSRRLLVVVAFGLAAAGAFGGALVASSGGGPAPVSSALPSLSVFDAPGPDRIEPELTDLSVLGDVRMDMTRLQVLTNGLGKYGSRVVAFPSESGSTICYALLGAVPEDPGMSYCYQPLDPNLPAGLRGQHFDAKALWTALDGVPLVQLFGIAFDDVVSMRVQVSGEWRDVSIAKNGFYLEIPGVQHEAVGIVEATLADGTVQVHDIQRGA